MHVRVDEAGDQGLVGGELDHLDPRQAGAERLDGRDDPVEDADLVRADALRRQHVLAPDDEVVGDVRHVRMICRFTSLYNRYRKLPGPPA